VADSFRAWTSGAMIWLFPGKDIPITAGNIIKCLDTATGCATRNECPPVKYFASVPYVLQSLEANERGLQYLQQMDIVGVGGAALPDEVGDRMVEKGVNLISRFGSAECGFLMSSHRDYENDKAWQYLRSDQGSERLSFEKQEDGLSELVIPDGWPHMASEKKRAAARSTNTWQAKRNRDDRSFATADLFAAHDSLPNAWRYHSRADSQLTLITGKKFDPAPMEAAIAASSKLSDVLIFGNGQPYPGVLLFRGSGDQRSKEALQQQIWTVIEKINSESADHARIPKEMILVLPCPDSPLEKSSKGSLIRGAAEQRFADVIDKAYAGTGGPGLDNVADEDVRSAIANTIQSIVPHKGTLEDDTDLFAYGVDSVAGMRLRYGLRQLIAHNDKQLPLNIVEDCGTVNRLADYVVAQRRGHEFGGDDVDEKQLMLELVDKYSKFDVRNTDLLTNGELRLANQQDVVVLTGATGALGAHILGLCSRDPSVSKVYCLVRGSEHEASVERVKKALAQRGLDALDERKVVVLQTTLAEDRLGLSDNDYRELTREASIILHVAWSVNFRMRLRSFEKDNIASEYINVGRYQTNLLLKV